jgi:hypothetical protein
MNNKTSSKDHASHVLVYLQLTHDDVLRYNLIMLCKLPIMSFNRGAQSGTYYKIMYCQYTQSVQITKGNNKDYIRVLEQKAHVEVYLRNLIFYLWHVNTYCL